jgi:acetoin utilization deacetylase AcuC-like enzyme
MEFWENADTKRRFHNLLVKSNLINHLYPLKAREATISELSLFHSKEYIDKIQEMSKKGNKIVH